MQSSGGNAAYSVMANLCFIGKNKMKMNKSVLQGIVNSGKVKDFENFLRENGIEYNWYDCEVDGKKAIYCHFDNKEAELYSI